MTPVNPTLAEIGAAAGPGSGKMRGGSRPVDLSFPPTVRGDGRADRQPFRLRFRPGSAGVETPVARYSDKIHQFIIHQPKLLSVAASTAAGHRVRVGAWTKCSDPPLPARAIGRGEKNSRKAYRPFPNGIYCLVTEESSNDRTFQMEFFNLL